MPRKDDVQLARAKSMRSLPTGAEAKLWQHLRGKRLNGVKFTRQVLVGPYIVDFAARMHNLAVELDGDSHGHQRAYDDRRTVFLTCQGWRVIRFTNLDVMQNVEGVLAVIESELETPPLPDPLPRGEREI